MNALLTAKNNETLVLSFNQKALNEMNDIECNFNFDMQSSQQLDKEYILSQVARTGRYYTSQKMSNRSINKFKDWALENDVKTTGDFTIEF